MTRQKADDVKKEVEEQKDEFYGEGTASGSSSGGEAVDVDKVMTDAFGDDVEEKIEKHNPFVISEEISSDEDKRRGK